MSQVEVFYSDVCRLDLQGAERGGILQEWNTMIEGRSHPDLTKPCTCPEEDPFFHGAWTRTYDPKCPRHPPMSASEEAFNQLVVAKWAELGERWLDLVRAR